MLKKIQKTTVKGIIEKNGKILLVKDHKGTWELPGGRIEHGETPKESLVREFNEELGWTNLSIDKLIDAWSFTSKIKDRYNHFIVLVYSCNSNETNIKENDEYTEYKWIPIKDIKNLNTKDGYKESIKKFLQQK